MDAKKSHDQRPNYKKTLNLPKTKFAMKANLVQREPTMQKAWAKASLYDRVREARSGADQFLFHDGPPYANGSIHLGHLLNKVLKDIVVRSKTMNGLDVPYVPGWDCHGLPIEHKVMEEILSQDDGATDLTAMDIRQRCKKYASKFVKLQSKQMQRLGTLADYDNPYLTMVPTYESAVLEVFADLVEADLVDRQLKPVHWSIANQTALAEAELEYEDREDTSVFVLFEIENPSDLPDSLMARPDGPIHLMIWTTTPWTLPANMAVTLAPRATYQLYQYQQGETIGSVIVAEELSDKVFDLGDAVGDPRGCCTGDELAAAGIRYHHPFIERTGPVVTAEYVTLEDGTGMVHTAPGHGVEDYQTGLQHNIPIYCPVLADGTFDQTAPEWLVGQTVWQGNDLVIDQLKSSGHLFYEQVFTHSYPHDWRSKTPVIFRATEQWFVVVDHPEKPLRQMALDQTASSVDFYPSWGRNRMRGMLESRPDWCVSRQRAWGLPIPAFFGADANEVLLTPASVRAVAAVVATKGSDAWFTLSAAELLADYDVSADDQAPAWAAQALADGGQTISKANDIFDVWFESGSSWHAVMQQRLGQAAYPVDLYLEGSDQHRGWFQLSLLPALGATGQAPFRSVLTHGFMVDKNGRKMSKSQGNAVSVDELLQELGADVLRWWVCSLNADNDIKIDRSFFALAGEEYRKVRNTIRFLLSNLNDYDHATHQRPLTEADRGSIDAWAMSMLNELIDSVQEAYQQYSFRKAHEAIFRFCNETLSSVYLTAAKDRLYCDPIDSDRRRRCQTVIYEIASALIRLLAPVLVHTAEEAWQALHGRSDQPVDSETSVHLALLPAVEQIALAEGWADAMALRDRVLKLLEATRQNHAIDNPLDAGVEVMLPAEVLARFEPLADELADLCGVSRWTMSAGDQEEIKIVDLTDQPRCERSWKRDGTVAERADGGWLSERDAQAVGQDS